MQLSRRIPVQSYIALTQYRLQPTLQRQSAVIKMMRTHQQPSLISGASGATSASGNEDFPSIIKKDHAEIDQYFKGYFKTPKNDVDNRRRYLNSLIRALAVHSTAEELTFYPVLIKHMSNGEELAAKNREEHLEVKKDLQRVDFMRMDDETLDPLLKKLHTEFLDHIKLEEEVELPQLKSSLTDSQAEELTETYLKYKTTAPTHPHPSAPDKGGMLEKAAGVASLPMDKLIDSQREFVKET
ncbi:hypothetical protein SeLEV6574_g03644 [Synchytrium endobioticum]|nr:hypothetical protein SeLEV6574_g03644 [Synchytrium endobioticum]